MDVFDKVIVGVSGKARHGKDCAAEAMVAAYGFQVIYFASALKDAAAAVFGLSYDQLYGKAKETVDPFWGESPRVLLQRMGTDAMRRNVRDDVWVRALERRIAALPKGTRVVVPDVRFPNEADAIKAWGGRVLRVIRIGHPGLPGALGQHPSETALDSYTGFTEVVKVPDGQVETLRAFGRDFAREAIQAAFPR